MNYDNEIKIWASSLINILDVKHGLLIRQEITDYFESSALIFAVGGNGSIVFDGFSYPVKSNCLVHLGANKQITIRSETDELEYYAVIYHAELSPSAGRELIVRSLRQNPFQRCYALHTSTPAFFSEQFIAMTNEWSNITPLSLLNMKQRVYSVISTLYADLLSERAVLMEHDSFDYAYHYLQRNYAGAVSIQALADSLGIARSTLHKQFKERIGKSPQQYLMQLRLDAACRILETSRISVDEIAASCGLRDKSYFTRVFKEMYGVTPGTYRQAHSSDMNSGILRTNTKPITHERKEEYIVIESLGRIHRYFEVPRRIVCLDYSTAEICAALGVADRITGVASAEEALADCGNEYRRDIAKAPFLQPFSSELNVPSFRAVCDCKPDIVIGTGFSFDRYGGIADAEDFEREGIHIYALKATYTLDCDYESVYEDIRNLGQIFKREARAEEIIRKMKSEEADLQRAIDASVDAVRVFSFDSSVSERAITCGKSLEKHIIDSAGGKNIFGDREGQFVAVDWCEVGAADPQVILVHCFHTQHDGLQKIAFLKQIPEIANTEAMRNGRIHLVGIKKVFPALDNVETAKQLAEVFRNTAASVSQ